MAIARDSFSSGFQASGTSGLNFTHSVVSNTNSLALIFVTDWGGDHVTGVTCTKGGTDTAMTQLAKAQGDVTTGGENYIYGLLMPDSGTITFKISRSSTSGSVYGISAVYTGVRQYTLPDAVVNGSRRTAANQFGGVTTVSDLCWVFAGFENGNSIGAPNSKIEPSDGFSTIIKNTINTSDGVAAFDNQGNGAITPAGAYSMTVNNENNNAGTTWGGGVSVSFAPVKVNIVTLTETQASTDTITMIKKRFITLVETLASTDVFAYLTDRWHAQAKSSGSWTAQTKSQ